VTDQTAEQQLAAIRRQMAAPGPTPEQQAEWDTADRAMAERIRTGRPGVPLHHAFATLQTLRTIQWLDETAGERPACPNPVECGHEAALGQAREEARRLGLMVDEYSAGARTLGDKIRRVREVLAFAEKVVATSGPGPASAVQAVADRLHAALDGPVPDDSDPADLTGYLAPEPAIRCLTALPATATEVEVECVYDNGCGKPEGECAVTCKAVLDAIANTIGKQRTAAPTPAVPVEVRDPCPRCESSSDRIPRRLMADHLRDVHPEEQR